MPWAENEKGQDNTIRAKLTASSGIQKIQLPSNFTSILEADTISHSKVVFHKCSKALYRNTQMRSEAHYWLAERNTPTATP